MTHELTPAHYAEIDRLAVQYDLHPVAIEHQLAGTLVHRVPSVDELSRHAESLAARVYLGNPIRNAIHAMNRTTAYHWAVATNSKMTDVMAWVSDNKWSAHDLVKAFPITLPRTEDGLIDPTQLDLGCALNLALVCDQQMHIFEASSAGGGDDAWFDYIPDAISMLSALQAENWADTVAFVINNPHVFTFAHPDPDDAIADARQEIMDKGGFTIMDDASQLLLALMPEIHEGNTDISFHGPTPFA